MNCMGYENSVSQCSKTQYPSVTCPTNYFAEIRCYEGGSINTFLFIIIVLIIQIAVMGIFV